MRPHAVLTIATALAPALAAQTIQAPYSSAYSFVELASPPGVPGNYGGVAFEIGDPNTLYLGGQAATPVAAVYRVTVTRDAAGHITGFSAAGVKHADAPDLDGGLQFGPGGVLFFTRYSNNELGQIAPGSAVMTKSVPLTPLGVARSVGALSFIPAGHPRAGDLKLMSYSASTAYTAALVPDGTGTYDVASVTTGPRIVGNPEGFVYPPPGSPHFTPFEHMIVCEFSSAEISVFHLDAAGEPEPATRQVFMTGITGCIGAAIDPISGDFVFSTYGFGSRLLAVRGLGIPCGRIIRYGMATAGSAGLVPTLTSEGCFARRQTVSFVTGNGLGGAFGVMLTGLASQDLPFLGIRVLVNPFATITHVLAGTPGVPGEGTFSLGFPIPDSTILLGADFFFQSVYLDPGASQGLSATDGIELNVR